VGKGPAGREMYKQLAGMEVEGGGRSHKQLEGGERNRGARAQRENKARAKHTIAVRSTNNKAHMPAGPPARLMAQQPESSNLETVVGRMAKASVAVLVKSHGEAAVEGAGAVQEVVQSHSGDVAAVVHQAGVEVRQYGGYARKVRVDTEWRTAENSGRDSGTHPARRSARER